MTSCEVYPSIVVGMMADYGCSLKTAMSWDMEIFGINLKSGNREYIERELKHYFLSYGMCEQHRDSWIDLFMSNKDYGLTPRNVSS